MPIHAISTLLCPSTNLLISCSTKRAEVQASLKLQRCPTWTFPPSLHSRWRLLAWSTWFGNPQISPLSGKLPVDFSILLSLQPFIRRFATKAPTRAKCHAQDATLPVAAALSIPHETTKVWFQALNLPWPLVPELMSYPMGKERLKLADWCLDGICILIAFIAQCEMINIERLEFEYHQTWLKKIERRLCNHVCLVFSLHHLG